MVDKRSFGGNETHPLELIFYDIISRMWAKIHVGVDSLSVPESAGKVTYILLPGLQGVEPSDLQFKEFKAYVERALNSRGFFRARTIDDATVAIFLAYGIGDPRDHIYSYSVPVWG